MPSADGFIKFTAGRRFAATFIINEITFNFSGSFASSVPSFTCNTATLDYPDLKVVSSTRSFGGHVGPSEVQLNLANGLKINGVLDMPLSPGSTVLGSGVWTQN